VYDFCFLKVSLKGQTRLDRRWKNKDFRNFTKDGKNVKAKIIGFFGITKKLGKLIYEVFNR